MGKIWTLAVEGIHKYCLIAPGTYMISESGIVNSYLVIGKDKALLIDTGDGIGDISSCVKEITDKELIVVLTHRHPDHDGGGSFFQSLYCGKKDDAKVYKRLSSRFMRQILLLGGKFLDKSLKHIRLSKGPYKTIYNFVDEGYVFHLGARDINVISTPGHTMGSIVLIDEKEKIMFTGDDVNESLWLQLQGCSTISEWLPGAKRILELSKKYTAYGGHSLELISTQDISTLIALGEKALITPKDELKGWPWIVFGKENESKICLTLKKKNIR